MFLKLVLQAGTSLRGTAKTLQIVFGTFGRSRAPTYHCGRIWLMRLGLYHLQRPLPAADDWIWIVDHTVQIGDQRCFAVVGVQLSDMAEGWLTPELSQLCVLAIEPVHKSNGDIIKEQLVEVAKRTGAPREIVSDGSPELNRGVALLREIHPGTVACYDVKHKMALIHKKALENDDRWVKFSKAVHKTRQATLPSRFAHLAPPALKNKARYMNMGPLIAWTRRIKEYLANPLPPSKGEQVELGPLNIHFKWILDYEEDIPEWNRQLEILDTTTDHCRRYGYYREITSELRPVLKGIAQGPRTQQMAEEVLAFLAEQSLLVQDDERLLATSECIESLFAKEKHLEKQQAASGFTGLLLGLGALVEKITPQVIEQAFTSTTTRDVKEWAQEKIGLTVQAKRHRTLGQFNSGTKTAQKRLVEET